MKKVLFLILLLFSLNLYTFDLQEIREIPIDYLLPSRVNGVHPVPGGEYVLLTTDLGYFLVDFYGNIIRVFHDRKEKIFIPYDGTLAVQKNNYLERYDLKQRGKRISRQELNISYLPPELALCNIGTTFLDREYYCFQKNVPVMENNKRVWNRELHVYYRKSGGTELKFLKKMDIAWLTNFHRTDYGLLSSSYANHNRVIRSGLADFYAGILLMGYSGDVIASYRFYGKNMGAGPFHLHGHLAYLNYSEHYAPDRKKAGMMIFDIKSWRLKKALPFQSAMCVGGNPSETLRYHGQGFDCLVATEDGTIYCVDEQLNVRWKANTGLKREIRTSYDRREDYLSYQSRYNTYTFVFCGFMVKGYDPRVKPTSLTRRKHFRFIVLDGKGNTIYRKSFAEKEGIIITLVNTGQQQVAFFKKRKIEIYKIIY